MILNNLRNFRRENHFSNQDNHDDSISNSHNNTDYNAGHMNDQIIDRSKNSNFSNIKHVTDKFTNNDSKEESEYKKGTIKQLPYNNIIEEWSETDDIWSTSNNNNSINSNNENNYNKYNNNTNKNTGNDIDNEYIDFTKTIPFQTKLHDNYQNSNSKIQSNNLDLEVHSNNHLIDTQFDVNNSGNISNNINQNNNNINSINNKYNVLANQAKVAKNDAHHDNNTCNQNDSCEIFPIQPNIPLVYTRPNIADIIEQKPVFSSKNRASHSRQYHSNHTRYKHSTTESFNPSTQNINHSNNNNINNNNSKSNSRSNSVNRADQGNNHRINENIISRENTLKEQTQQLENEIDIYTKENTHLKQVRKQQEITLAQLTREKAELKKNKFLYPCIH
jgi:hypothetical protein